MRKYYAHAKNSNTLRAIKANSDEEALQKCIELFGEDNFVCGQLPHVDTTSWKEKRDYYKMGYEAVGLCGKALDSAMHMTDNLHAVGAF